MRRALLIFTMICIVTIGFAGVANASSHAFYLVNYTGVDLYGVYVSPSSSEKWGPNILNGVLPNGYQVQVTLFFYSPSWDLMIQDRYGNRVYWRNISLSDIDRYTLYR